MCYRWSFTFLALSLPSECSEDRTSVTFIRAVSVTTPVPCINETGKQCVVGFIRQDIPGMLQDKITPQISVAFKNKGLVSTHSMFSLQLVGTQLPVTVTLGPWLKWHPLAPWWPAHGTWTKGRWQKTHWPLQLQCGCDVTLAPPSHWPEQDTQPIQMSGAGRYVAVFPRGALIMEEQKEIWPTRDSTQWL